MPMSLKPLVFSLCNLERVQTMENNFGTNFRISLYITKILIYGGTPLKRFGIFVIRLQWGWMKGIITEWDKGSISLVHMVQLLFGHMYTYNILNMGLGRGFGLPGRGAGGGKSHTLTNRSKYRPPWARPLSSNRWEFRSRMIGRPELSQAQMNPKRVQARAGNHSFPVFSGRCTLTLIFGCFLVVFTSLFPVFVGDCLSLKTGRRVYAAGL